jgi:hypothetical protein
LYVGTIFSKVIADKNDAMTRFQSMDGSSHLKVKVVAKFYQFEALNDGRYYQRCQGI